MYVFPEAFSLGVVPLVPRADLFVSSKDKHNIATTCLTGADMMRARVPRADTALVSCESPWTSQMMKREHQKRRIASYGVRWGVIALIRITTDQNAYAQNAPG